MHDLTTECSFDTQATWVIDVLGLFIDMPSMVVCTTRHCETSGRLVQEIEVPSRVDGKRRNLARVSDFVSWDEACRVPRHKITHECKIPPLSIHE